MTEHDNVPTLGILLGYAPATLTLALGIAGWVLPPLRQPAALLATQLWAGAILVFLAGVRRGLSFFTDDGPRPDQVITAMLLFGLGLVGLVVPFLLAFPVLMLGYLAVAVLDPRAAPSGEVPAYFARLRPPQMAIFILGLIAAFARVLAG